MKKLLFCIIAAVLLVSPLAAAVPLFPSLGSPHSQSKHTQPTSTFTHTVFIDEGTTTWCPNCPQAAEALRVLYSNNSQYPFYYTALVVNRNKNAAIRFHYHYGGTAIPTLFFDGGNKSMVGITGNQQTTQAAYRNLINQCGSRAVHPLELNTSVVGHNNSKYDITVTIKNTGSSLYIGILQSSVSEIVSRWKDQQSHPYHFAFLSYALQRIVILQPQKSKTFHTTWNGAAKHGNLTFPNLNDSNVMVISTAADIHPHQIPAEQYIRKHIAFYVDQTSGATVSKE